MGKRESVFNITNGKCYYCGCKLDFDNFHMDHFEAKSKGGKVYNNLVPACPDCNILKSDRSIEEFRGKINDLLTDNIHGRVLAKYYGLEAKQHKFFFEGMQDGDL